MLEEEWAKFTKGAWWWFKWGMILCTILIIGIYAYANTIDDPHGLKKVIIALTGMFVVGVAFHATMASAFTAGMYMVGDGTWYYGVGAALFYYAAGYAVVNYVLGWVAGFIATESAKVAGGAAEEVTAAALMTETVAKAAAQSPFVGGMVESMYGGCGCAAALI